MMLSDSELDALLRDIESDRVERKASFSDPDRVRDTLLPTYLGMLIHGKDLRRYLPGAYIQFLRVDGTSLTDPILDAKEIVGTIPDQLRQLDELMKAHISTAVDPNAGTLEVQRPDYPFSALLQIARNAVIHRNYDDTNAPVRLT
jgi:ATP-dependent DNA helicase RecG